MPEVRHISTLQETLRKTSLSFSEILMPVATRGSQRLKQEILLNLSGKVLNRRSGDLYRSVEARARTVEGGVEIEASAGGVLVPYASIHEYGGNAGRGGRTPIKARPYMLPAVEREMDRMMPEISEAITDSMIYGPRRRGR